MCVAKGFLVYIEYPTPEIGWAVSKDLFNRGVKTGGTLNNIKVNRIKPYASFATKPLIQ